MVYGDRERTLPLGGANQRLEKRSLGDFQRYAIRRLQSIIPFEEYSTSASNFRAPEQLDMHSRLLGYI
jgi:hypothetical protein